MRFVPSGSDHSRREEEAAVAHASAAHAGTSETLCLDCHCWSWRYYHDPGFMTSEDHEKFRFEKFDQTHAAKMAARRAIMPN